jgi:hypothetical protein
MLYISPFESWNDLCSIVHIINFLNDAIELNKPLKLQGCQFGDLHRTRHGFATGMTESLLNKVKTQL